MDLNTREAELVAEVQAQDVEELKRLVAAAYEKQKRSSLKAKAKPLSDEQKAKQKARQREANRLAAIKRKAAMDAIPASELAKLKAEITARVKAELGV